VGLGRSAPGGPVAALVAGTLAVSACSGGAPAASGAPARTAATSTPAGGSPAPVGATSLTWSACGGDKDAGDSCARLRVPLDRSQPAGRTLELQLIRRVAGDPRSRLGSLLINPGGPGGSTVDEFDGLVGQLSAGLTRRFDVVGFDPRGVGASEPVRCAEGPQLDRLLADSPDPLTAAGRAQIQRDAQEQVTACEQHSGELLPFVGTVDAAKDMDAIRAAVGDERLSYLGYSYGTLLGATYASLFPDRVRALVLDGAVDPGLAPVAATEVQARGFQSALEAFLADCGRQGQTCRWQPGGDLLAAYRRLADRVRATPMRTADPARPLTLSLLQTGVAAALYRRDSWPILAQALSRAEGGDATVLLRLADLLQERHEDGTYSSLVASNTAVNCRDAASPLGLTPYVDSYRRLQTAAPDFASFALSGYTCAIWPARPAVEPPPLTVRGAPPILVVGTTGDPATPFSEAVGLTGRIAGAVLLTRQGDGHTGYDASQCVRAKVDAYLLDPASIPPPGTVCGS